MWQFAKDFLRPHAGRCAVVGVFMVLSVLIQLPLPILTMYIVDHVFNSHNDSLVTVMTLSLAALIIIRYAFSYLNESLTLRIKETVILEVERALIERIQRLPLSFFYNKHSSYLQTRVMSDARAVEGVLVRTLVSIAIDTLTFLVGLALVLYLKYQLGLMLFVFLVPFAYIKYFANERMRLLSKDMQEAQAVASAVMSESFAGVRTIKAYLREEFQEHIIRERLERLRDIYIKTNRFGIVSTVGTGFLTALCGTFVLWYGARSVMDGHMTLGQVVAILSLLNLLYGPINNFVAANLRMQQSSTAIQRIYEFLKEPSERHEGETVDNLEGKIEFEDVSFAYSAGDDVIKHVSFSVEAGTAVALVGQTGAGKSSIVNLLLRFYEIERGRILIDGKNINGLSLASLRGQIGVVDQQAFLFSGTILDNIRFGKPDASLEEIVNASRLSYAHEFIEKLPDGFETRIGERGVRLSGGQCQRIALARMFLKNPKILILDEAVSAIDSDSEKYIQRALAPLMATRTTIIIAHRLSSLMLADQVIVLDEGSVVEQGPHYDLMRADGTYTRLFYEQFNTQLKKRDGPEPAVVMA
jgi:ABC-type multidrug transport system fused ATPase/permease subunit